MIENKFGMWIDIPSNCLIFWLWVVFCFKSNFIRMLKDKFIEMDFSPGMEKKYALFRFFFEREIWYQIFDGDYSLAKYVFNNAWHPFEWWFHIFRIVENSENGKYASSEWQLN